MFCMEDILTFDFQHFWGHWMMFHVFLCCLFYRSICSCNYMFWIISLRRGRYSTSKHHKNCDLPVMSQASRWKFVFVGVSLLRNDFINENMGCCVTLGRFVSHNKTSARLGMFCAVEMEYLVLLNEKKSLRVVFMFCHDWFSFDSSPHLPTCRSLCFIVLQMPVLKQSFAEKAFVKTKICMHTTCTSLFQ